MRFLSEGADSTKSRNVDLFMIFYPNTKSRVLFLVHEIAIDSTLYCKSANVVKILVDL